jgi:hypothetical protein
MLRARTSSAADDATALTSSVMGTVSTNSSDMVSV